MRLHRHQWEKHPEFGGLNRLNPEGLVRRCTKCPRVESRAFTGVWRHKPHLEQR